MRNAYPLWCLAAAMLMVASPASAGPRAQQIISKLKAVFGKSAPQPAARNAVNAAKPVLQRGKATLEAQKANYIDLSVRANILKEQRSDLRSAARDARAALMSDRSNPARRAAFDQAMAAYAPVREAHVSARDARDAAGKRYQLTQSQMGSAMNAATGTAGARAARPPSQGVPRMRRQAFVATEPGFASAAKSPNPIYVSLSLMPSQPSSGSPHYAIPVAAFRSQALQSPYDRLSSFEAGSRRQSGSAVSMSGSSSMSIASSIGGSQQLGQAGSLSGSSMSMASSLGGAQQSGQAGSVGGPMPQVQSFAPVTKRINQSIYDDVG